MNRAINQTIRTAIRKYHVPHDGKNKMFKREDNLFGQMQDALSTQLNIKKVVITINNPIYVSKESTEQPTPYTVDMFYRNSRMYNSLEGDECETIVRQTIGYVYQQYADESFPRN